MIEKKQSPRFIKGRGLRIHLGAVGVANAHEPVRSQTQYAGAAKSIPVSTSGAKGSHGRVHLPVAPACNIKCNYCDRKYSCVNESRPGVTSAVLAPHQAQEYFDRVLEAEPRISVAGIAGPGDPMANAAKTLQTMRLIRRALSRHPPCACPPTAWPCPSIWTPGRRRGDPHDHHRKRGGPGHRGQDLLLGQGGQGGLPGQKRRPSLLLGAPGPGGGRAQTERGITVKLNSIVIPGDQRPAYGARWPAGDAELGADLMNLMPMYPTPGHAFRKHLGEPQPVS